MSVGKTNDLYLYVRHHETPREVAAQSQVQAPPGPSICGDVGPIGSVQDVVRALPATWQDLAWENAQVGPSVHYIPLFGGAVGYEEAAGACGPDVSRR